MQVNSFLQDGAEVREWGSETASDVEAVFRSLQTCMWQTTESNLEIHSSEVYSTENVGKPLPCSQDT